MYLGIDLGTSAVKAFLMDDRQIRIGSASVEIAVVTPKPGHVEQEPSQWERATDAAILQLKAGTPDELGAVRGIGLSGHMHGATLVDASDKVIRPCILWNDTRSHLEASELDGKPAFRRLLIMVRN